MNNLKNVTFGHLTKFIFIQLPILLLLNISIPVVDNSLEMNGWSKLLNTLQIIILPLVIVFVSDGTYCTYDN